jgi:hypothetical protein
MLFQFRLTSAKNCENGVEILPERFVCVVFRSGVCPGRRVPTQISSKNLYYGAAISL